MPQILRDIIDDGYAHSQCSCANDDDADGADDDDGNGAGDNDVQAAVQVHSRPNLVAAARHHLPIYVATFPQTFGQQNFHNYY